MLLAIKARTSRIRFAALILALLILSPNVFPTAHAVDAPVKILRVEYPTTVTADSSFPVTVEVAYSSRFGMMDIGLWDLENGTVIQEVVSNVTQGGAGESSYTLEVNAPSRQTTWHVAAIARVWIQEAWFYDKDGEVEFSVNVIDHAFLTLTNLQRNSTLSVDGENVTLRDPTAVFRLSLTVTHSVEVSPLIQIAPGERLVFTNWSDGEESNPRDVALSENVTLAPIYRIQYLLAVSSDLSQTQGGGWYWAGDTAVFGIPSATINSPGFVGLPVGGYHFAAWSGDSDSTSSTATIFMDGPKQVRARWIYEPAGVSLGWIGAIFVIASIILLARATWLVSRRSSRGLRPISPARMISGISIVLLLLLPVVAATGVPTPARPEVVEIGDAAWYYWAQPSSDSCVLWLGGGVEYSQGGYLINPFEYESFGTIRFLQDISKYYCLLALEQGTSASSNLPNRTIYQELIQRHSSIGRQAHEWLNAQGYRHVFLTGYSVGAEAAVSLAIDDPAAWTSSDGLILITSRLSPDLIAGAPTLNTNLMLLYGHAPTFEPSGRRFYQLAPTEGWHGTEYLHKEYHVLDQMSHEVWSPLKDNSYSPTALGIFVNFIQTAVALQFSPLNFAEKPLVSNPAYVIKSVGLPSKATVGTPFLLVSTIMPTGPTPQTPNESAVIVVDNTSMTPVASSEFLPNSTNQVRVLLSPTVNTSRTVLLILVVTKSGSEWAPASSGYFTAISITNEVSLRIGGLVPNSSLTLDNSTYSVPPNGVLQLNTTIGIHSISVDAFVEQTGIRDSFIQWDNGNTSTTRTTLVDHDVNITALYHREYLVNVTSPFGAPGGSGWYDANSTILPPLNACVRPDLVFGSWNTENGLYTAGEPIPVNSALNVQAVWIEGAQSYSTGDSWTSLATLAFSLLLLLNLRLRRE